jgi:hypothetical protein
MKVTTEMIESRYDLTRDADGTYLVITTHDLDSNQFATKSSLIAASSQTSTSFLWIFYSLSEIACSSADE